MEVITFESEAYKKLIFNIEQNRRDTATAFKLLADAKSDRYMTPLEVQEFTGFGYAWVYERRNHFGCFTDGKGLRFLRSNVEAYMKANTFKLK